MLTKEFPHNLAGRGADGRDDIKGSKLEGQALKIDPSQMLVAGRQEGAVEKGGFGEDQTVVKLRLGQQSYSPKMRSDAPGDIILCFDEFKGPNVSIARELEGAHRAVALLEIVSVQGVFRQFLSPGWREQELGLLKAAPDDQDRVSDIFDLLGQIPKNVRIKGCGTF